jgi:hypothetical protein
MFAIEASLAPPEQAPEQGRLNWYRFTRVLLDVVTIYINKFT